MIISQFMPQNIAALTFANANTPSPAEFQTVTTVGGTPNGIAAGNVNLPIGQGFLFGTPFRVYMQGNLTITTTSTTVQLGLVFGTAVWTSGAKPATSFRTTGTASASLAAGKHAFVLEALCYVDALSQTLNGYITDAFDSAAPVDKQAALTQATGLSLPAFATPYSWNSPITGIDGAQVAASAAGDGPQNAPFIYLVPEFTVTTATTASIALQSLQVTQG